MFHGSARERFERPLVNSGILRSTLQPYLFVSCIFISPCQKSIFISRKTCPLEIRYKPPGHLRRIQIHPAQTSAVVVPVGDQPWFRSTILSPPPRSGPGGNAKPLIQDPPFVVYADLLIFWLPLVEYSYDLSSCSCVSCMHDLRRLLFLLLSVNAVSHFYLCVVLFSANSMHGLY
jgi:hypothetical protein